jgi:hypothetical protein
MKYFLSLIMFLSLVALCNFVEAQTAPVNVSWVDNSINETGFRLQRKTGTTGTWANITPDIAVNATTFVDTVPIDPLKTIVYIYRIQAFNTIGVSGFSNEASITFAKQVPNNPGTLKTTK